jgi:predicted regulator of Ras-like GTPase activity (Roadblock/LC7/MglB family)
VPYLLILEQLLGAVAGVQAALLLDTQGEVVVATPADDRHRLIAAYQGIALLIAQRTSRRYAVGRIGHVLCRYSRGSVLLRPLKDGYYLLVSLTPEASLALATRHSAETARRLDAEL